MNDPKDSVEMLRAMLSEERMEKMEQVLSRRLHGTTVLLEDVYKAQNMSACIRTLEAFGIQNVHIVEGTAPFIVSRKTTQGCHKWVDIHRHIDAPTAVQDLKSRGYRVLATSLNAKRTIEEIDFETPTALCFGNEKDGISEELLELADDHFRIPMFGFTQSFNLNVAVSLCMWQATSRRRLAIQSDTDLTPEQLTELRDRWIHLALKDSDRILDALSARDEHS